MSAPVFTFTEILSLLGLIQSVYVLVYMIFRSGNWRYAILPIAYFSVLALAFLFDAAATRWQELIAAYDFYRWAFWFSGVPLATLLVFQIARTPDLPPFRYAALLFVIPLALSLHFVENDNDDGLLYTGGLIAGALSLLAVWLRRDLLDSLTRNLQKGGERFWLILALIVMQVAFLASTFAYLNEWLPKDEWVVVRNALGLGLVYVAATSLLRIYPQAIKLTRGKEAPGLSADDQDIVNRLVTLFERDKVYQEPDLGRAELARELNVGEATLSRIINVHYGKTIPQLLNDYRVKDAQRLLRETKASINDIFAESGFSSMTTFNRVFKEITGVSPTEFRGRPKH